MFEWMYIIYCCRKIVLKSDMEIEAEMIDILSFECSKKCYLSSEIYYCTMQVKS